MKLYLSKRERLEKQAHGELLIELGAFAEFWEGPYVTPNGDICSICGGDFPFAGEHNWGLKPDRDHRPNLFICWECVHWLFKTFADQIANHSYGRVFSDYPPFEHTLGQPAGIAIISKGERTP